MYMMKKILLLAGIVSLAACTNDPEETFSQGGGSSAGVKVIYDAEGAVEGQLIVKFRPSAADSLATALSVCTNGTWLPSTSRFPCVKWSAN